MLFSPAIQSHLRVALNLHSLALAILLKSSSENWDFIFLTVKCQWQYNRPWWRSRLHGPSFPLPFLGLCFSFLPCDKWHLDPGGSCYTASTASLSITSCSLYQHAAGAWGRAEHIPPPSLLKCSEDMGGSCSLCTSDLESKNWFLFCIKHRAIIITKHNCDVDNFC